MLRPQLRSAGKKEKCTAPFRGADELRRQLSMCEARRPHPLPALPMHRTGFLLRFRGTSNTPAGGVVFFEPLEILKFFEVRERQ